MSARKRPKSSTTSAVPEVDLQQGEQLCRVVSPAGVLHLVPSNPKVTIEFCRAHGLRHDYTRNMMGLDKHHARDTHEGWVVLGKNEVWLRHEGHSVPIEQEKTVRQSLCNG